MVYADWIFISFDLAQSNYRIKPYPVPGMDSVYFADVTSRRNLGYFLLILYNNQIHDEEVERAFKSGINTNFPVVVYFHYAQLNVLNKSLLKLIQRKLKPSSNFPLNTEQDRIIDSIAACASKPLHKEIITSLVAFELEEDKAMPASNKSSRVQAKEEEVMISQLTDREQLVKTIYWAQPTFKRILFFTLLFQEVRQEDLQLWVSSPEPLEEMLSSLITEEILEFEDGKFKIRDENKDGIQRKIFEPAFGKTLAQIKERVEEILSLENLESTYIRPTHQILNKLTAETGKDDDPIHKNMVKTIIYRESSLYVIPLNQPEQWESELYASQAIIKCEQRSSALKVHPRLLPLLVAPFFSNDVVRLANKTTNRIFLIDLVNLLALEQRYDAKTQTETKLKIHAYLDKQPFGGLLWNPSKIP